MVFPPSGVSGRGCQFQAEERQTYRERADKDDATVAAALFAILISVGGRRDVARLPLSWQMKKNEKEGCPTSLNRPSRSVGSL